MDGIKPQEKNARLDKEKHKPFFFLFSLLSSLTPAPT